MGSRRRSYGNCLTWFVRLCPGIGMQSTWCHTRWKMNGTATTTPKNQHGHQTSPRLKRKPVDLWFHLNELRWESSGHDRQWKCMKPTHHARKILHSWQSCQYSLIWIEYFYNLTWRPAVLFFRSLDTIHIIHISMIHIRFVHVCSYVSLHTWLTGLNTSLSGSRFNRPILCQDVGLRISTSGKTWANFYLPSHNRT